MFSMTNLHCGNVRGKQWRQDAAFLPLFVYFPEFITMCDVDYLSLSFFFLQTRSCGPQNWLLQRLSRFAIVVDMKWKHL